MAQFAYSCVVDDDPVLIAQAFIWLNCLIDVKNVNANHIFIHTTKIRNVEFLDWVRSRGVNLIQITPFDQRSPHCNKIQQLSTFLETDYEQIIYMDCDTAWIGEKPPPLGAPVSASICHYALPPEAVVSEVFSRSGLGCPEWVPVAFPVGEGDNFSDTNNCNGGVYIVDRQFLRQLAPRWRFWAEWALDNIRLFKSWSVHADQMSFALAMRDLGARVRHIDLAWNYPTNVPGELLPDVEPQIIHFHRELTPQLKLTTVGRPRVDRAIEKVNEKIGGFLQNSLLNSVYWDFRYALHPELGSGIGSRGEPLSQKVELLRAAAEGFFERSVVDVGCGDLEATRSLPFTRYLGLDLSQKALETARAKRPDWEFRLFEQAAGIPAADLVLCLDVLIHQASEATFFAMVERLAAAGNSLIVSGYEAPPRLVSEITRYHLPITEALRRTGRFSSITIIGEYRDVVVVLAEKVVPKAARGESMEVNAYIDEERVGERVALGEHRTLVGGLWDEIGPLQLEFMTAHGLKPQHSLLDVGCGCLRGGVHFIRYLEPGHYVGVDISQSLLDAGYDIELANAGLQARMPRANLACFAEFEVHQLARQFDFALAVSLFTHLPFNHIRLCLIRLAEVVRSGGVFFATYFEVPEALPLAEPYPHPIGGITTYPTADPYHYRLADMFYAARNLPWEIRIVGDFAHPRDQKMLAFNRVG